MDTANGVLKTADPLLSKQKIKRGKLGRVKSAPSGRDKICPAKTRSRQKSKEGSETEGQLTLKNPMTNAQKRDFVIARCTHRLSRHHSEHGEKRTTSGVPETQTAKIDRHVVTTHGPPSHLGNRQPSSHKSLTRDRTHSRHDLRKIVNCETSMPSPHHSPPSPPGARVGLLPVVLYEAMSWPMGIDGRSLRSDW